MPWFQLPLALVIEGLAVPKWGFSVLNSVHIGPLDGNRALRSFGPPPSVFSPQDL